MGVPRFRFTIRRLIAVITIAAFAFGGVAAWRRGKGGPRPGASVTGGVAQQLAARCFGPGHWAARNASVMYYDPDRKLYLYAQGYERARDGAVVVRPFALIWRPSGGGQIRTATGDQARFMPGPSPGSAKSGAGSAPVRLRGNVRFRDVPSAPAATQDSSMDPPPFLEVSPGEESPAPNIGDDPELPQAPESWSQG